MPALRLIAFAILAACGTLGHAVGLGAIRVQSGLGQPLRATIPLFGADINDVGDACVKARLESVDGAFIVAPKVSLARGASTTSIVLSSLHDVNEPAVTLAVEIGCATPIQRSYQLLLDPPLRQPLLAQVQQPVQSDVVTNGGRPEAGFPLEAGDAGSAASLGPWNEKYLLRKKVRANPGKPRGTAEKSGLTRDLNGSMASRDVLKISDDSIGAGARLRLSDSLSESVIAADPAKAEENRLAQQRFAALLRGEDPVAVAEDNARNAQARVQALQAEAASYKLQTRSDKISLDVMREHSFTSTFVFSLGGLLLLSLGAVGWLGWRLRSSKASSKSGWWENNAPAAIEEKVDEQLPHSLQELKPAVVAHAPNAASQAADDLADNGQGFEEFIPEHPSAEAPKPNMLAVPPVQESPNNIAINPFAVKVASLKVEEISDVTQEAEFWMSLNDPQRALEILETQSDVERPVSPVPWLYLLDLYRETDNRAKYDALRARFKRLFNALIPEFDEPKEANPRTLEDFPHLMKRIADLWGGPESVSFLESLLVDDRDGARVGFELPVYRDILLLIGIAIECKHSGAGEPLLSGTEQQDYLIPEEIAPLDIDAHIPDIAVPEIVPPVGGERNPESKLLLDDINFEPMDFAADITPKST